MSPKMYMPSDVYTVLPRLSFVCIILYTHLTRYCSFCKAYVFAANICEVYLFVSFQYSSVYIQALSCIISS